MRISLNAKNSLVVLTNLYILDFGLEPPAHKSSLHLFVFLKIAFKIHLAQVPL